MSDKNYSELGWVGITGTPHDIGYALGVAGRKAAHSFLTNNEYWQNIIGPEYVDIVKNMTRRTQEIFPEIWQEISGLAEGLELPLEHVMAWNCRGDLMNNVPEGCTTVQIPGTEPLIAHNEDGLAAFRGHAFIADVTPDNAPGFVSFCYPGSIPGHTFAMTNAGLAQAVNNMRLIDVTPDIPRMVLGRAVLDCTSLNAALALLARVNNCGGFHFTLAQAGDDRLISVEIGGGAASQRQLTVPAIHANHSLLLDLKDESQEITLSSADRQARGGTLLTDYADNPIAILRDTGGSGLPIHRTSPEDPDGENTIATTVMSIKNSAIEWKIYDQISAQPVFKSKKFSSTQH